MSENRVLERIKECCEKHLSKLDLSECGLSEIPDEVAKLTWLQKLDLSYNKIIEINTLQGLTALTSLNLAGNQIKEIDALQKLAALTSLDLSGNQIKKIGALQGLTTLTSLVLYSNQIKEIDVLQGLTALNSLVLFNNQIKEVDTLQGLTALTKLNLAGNQIKEIEALQGLTALTSLNLYRNQIKDIEALQGLTVLTSLNLYSNQIKDIDRLRRLTALTSLDLYSNQIKEIDCLKQLKDLEKLELSQNRISQLPDWVGNSKINIVLKKQHERYENNLNLYNNPIENIPLEIIELGNKAIQGYLSTLDKHAKPINEIKVLFLGEGASGKTSLMKRFYGNPFNPHESQTHGINLSHKECGVNLKLWDFGGQEIMHHTHQFFLTQKSVYVLVLNARENSSTEYWLRMIEVFGGDSPIIIVMNKMDENPSAEENMKMLYEKYPNIQGYIPLSCKTDRGMDDFHRLIRETTTQLLHVKTRWGKHWLEVKKQLEKMRTGENLKDYISYEAYQAICEKKGVIKDQQDILLQWLNRLGIVTYFPDSGLNETNVINPEWLTEAFYSIINHPIVAKNYGILRLNELPNILDLECYSDKKYDFLLKLMSKFELCHPLNKQTYLFPNLLTKQEPNFVFDTKLALKFRFKYDSFLPKSILPKFVIRHYHERIDKQIWRTGIVIRNEHLDAKALIRLDIELNELNIFVNGEDKRGYLFNIVSEFETIHDEFSGLKYQMLIPCICSECDNQDTPFYFKYTMLQKALEKGRREYPCDKSFEDVPINQLLGILYSEQDIQKIVHNLIPQPLKIKQQLESLNIDAFIESVKSLFKSIPYLLIGKDEKSYHAPFHILLRSIYQSNARAEEMQNRGRIDSILETEQYIYIFELKYKGSAQEAIQQIHDRKYYDAYTQSSKEIILVGINFSEEEKNISDYLYEKLK